ncbi:LuxR C-terminal-related transcriptional regulator [Pseudonocardia abyssalis]|uniref:AAA family ATPase n=1 Tax=Pseudonocardia abyssalis TaxID=2792008 RepID=A0ABS6UMY4_9PSEU|nr:LuxR C-terminal-related transcriptional regulator [Pseudonocardia abyssalis]MBW0117363.1 AAA family ATPase [Pseudonocardia abyssalis]MBW0133606.1 AAA family ATPase [Pseudonocardia abyssalis]
MAGTVLASKLRVPASRGRSVGRPRLHEHLDRATGGTLTLVSAPAGFGKTTLLANWLASAGGRSTAWLSLDEQDDDPTRFWTHLVAALRTAPGSPDRFGDGALSLLTASRAPIESVLAALLDDLHARRDDLVLVLDDLHLVVAREVHDGLASLLERLPPHVHLMISTRADPPFPLARLRARGELTEVRAADLRFTPAEAAAYLDEVAGLDLAPSDVAALEERTEGWIAALQLAALSIRGRDDVSGFVSRFAGTDRYIVDYLVEEVLRHQSDDVRDFLARTAVLDRLTGSLCDAVTGRDDGARTLLALERANMFLIPLDDHREWYRYHHLFADVLRARIPPDQVPVLHRRAGGWHERHDRAEGAVRHALAAGDVDRAARLMERAVPAVRRARQDAMFLGWLRQLPDDVVRRSPVLGVFHGWMLMVSGDAAAFESRLDDAERALAAVPDGAAPPWADTEELHTLPATIAVYRASLAQARGDVAGTAEHARRALDLARPGDHLSRGAAAGFLGLAAWAEGDVTTALRTFGQAVAGLRAAGNLVDELSSTAVLADMWLTAGRPRTARLLCERALRWAGSRGVPRATAGLHVTLGELDRQAGDLDGARRHLETAAGFDARTATTEGRHRWFVAMALLTAAEGDPDGAVDLLDLAEQHHLPGFLPDVRPIPAVRARVRIAQGRPDEADGWARERGVTAAVGGGFLTEFDQLTLVRLLLAQDRAAQAVGLLDRLLAAAESSGRAGSVVEIRMLQALAHAARGDRPRARAALGRALADAPEPDGHVRLFLDEGAPLIALLRDAERHGMAHARRLLDAGPTPPSDDLLTARELQVLRLLDGELTGPQIARELFVTHNTLRTHTKHIFTKLDVTTRRAAVARARERGVL